MVTAHLKACIHGTFPVSACYESSASSWKSARVRWAPKTLVRFHLRPRRINEIRTTGTEPVARPARCVVYSVYNRWSPNMGPQFDYCLRATSEFFIINFHIMLYKSCLISPGFDNRLWTFYCVIKLFFSSAWT